MKKRKILKTISLAGLAVVIGAAGIFAFAPIGASASEPPATTTSGLGLDPKNDPVIYTTESGLEIKYGGATTALGGGNETGDFLADLQSGALSGYPYFTMGKYNGYDVNWVIIGKSTSGISASDFSNNITSYEKLSVWQTKLAESPTYKNWFENYFETYSPAGSLIESHGVLNDVTARNLLQKIQVSLLSSITANAEIDSGCVLAISEGALGQSTFGNNIIYEGSAVQTYCQNLYYTNLNLTNSQKALIKPQTIITNHTSQSTFCTSTEQYIFLSAEGAGIQYNNIKENFGYASYLSTSQYRLSVAYWIRSSGYNNLSQVCSTSGSELFPNYSCSSTYYVRPAMVVKLS